jgi:hypothetical protein
MRSHSLLKISSVLATALLCCAAARAQSCITYFPNPTIFPFFSTLGGAQYQSAFTITQPDGTVTQSTATSPIPTSGPGNILWASPRNYADAVFGSNGDMLFQSCAGVFPSAATQSVTSTNPDFSITESDSSSNGTMNITEQGTIIVTNLNGACPDTCLLDQGGYTKTYVYNIKNGGYTIQATVSEHTIFVDSSGVTTDGVTTLNGSASGTWPIVASSSLQITTSSLPGGQVGIVYDSSPSTATGGTPFPSNSYSYPYTWSATNLTPGLDISYFTGEIYGLPAAAGSFFPKLTVTDFDGNTASQDFTLAIQQPQTQSRFSPQQKAYYAQLAEYWLQQSDYFEQLYLDCKQATKGESPGDPTAANCQMASLLVVLTSAIGLEYNSKAGDPADPNYTSVATPTAPILSLPSTNSSWTAPQIAAFNAWIAVIGTEEQILGLSEAEITCINRAEGAYEAGSAYWEQQQVNALTRYSDLEAFDLQLLLTQLAQLEATYSQSGFQDVSINVAQATQFELGIAANGLPSALQTDLTTVGINLDGSSSIQKAFSSLNPNSVSGDTLQWFVPPSNVSTIIQQLDASFVMT